MSGTVSNILDYTEPPDPEVHERQSRTLWILAAVSAGMAVMGYLILATLIL